MPILDLPVDDQKELRDRGWNIYRKKAQRPRRMRRSDILPVADNVEHLLVDVRP